MIIALLIRFIHFSKLASTRKLSHESHDEPQRRPRWQQRLEIHETNWHVINEFITTNETRKLYIFENMKWRILYRAFQIYISSRSQTLDRPICFLLSLLLQSIFEKSNMSSEAQHFGADCAECIRSAISFPKKFRISQRAFISGRGRGRPTALQFYQCREIFY